MPTDASFRFSTYLALALACAALGYAEFIILPEAAGFAALAVVGLGVLYFLETRLSLLSIPAANRLGSVIGLVFLMWAGYRVKRELDTGEMLGMGWLTLGVAMFGPLVMMLIVGKVARRDKHTGDYWALHGMALAVVGLSAALDPEPVTFVLVGLYMVAAVWSLALFYLARVRGIVPPAPTRQRGPAAVPILVGTPAPRTGAKVPIALVLLALAVAVPLYLLTPRSGYEPVSFGQPRIEIAFAADQMTSLRHTGQLKPNPETAFEVTATHPDGTPMTSLPELRWRGTTRRVYQNGDWRPLEGNLPRITPLAEKEDRAEWTPPDLGPDQFTLSFRVPGRLNATPPLADPVLWVAHRPAPIATVTPDGSRAWLPVPNGNFYWDWSGRQRGTPLLYKQVYRIGTDPDLGPAFALSDFDRDPALGTLRHNPVPKVKEYADRVLAELVTAGRLPPECRDPKHLDQTTLLPHPRFHAEIARAFARYLATTPTLRYTTNLRIEDTKIDPVEDFLFNTKAGHCERFATALVLMLRSQGIPAVFVLGFKGNEHQSDGKYIVRQEHAHAWVEALVPDPPAPGQRFSPRTANYRWLSLDPTSGNADREDTTTWFQQAGNWIEGKFRQYLIDYTPEQRQKALAEVVAFLIRPSTLAVVAGLVALVLVARRARRWRARRVLPPPPAEHPNWFGELTALLAAHGIVPAPGDTALEFATAAAAELGRRPGCEQVAGVPLAWADAYYQDRFGGARPSDTRLAELDIGLAELRRSLAG